MLTTNRNPWQAACLLTLGVLWVPVSCWALGTEFDSLFGWTVNAGKAEVTKGQLHLQSSKLKAFGEVRTRLTLDLDQFPIMEIGCESGQYKVYLADSYRRENGHLKYIRIGNKLGKGQSRFYLQDLTEWSGRKNAVLVIQTEDTVSLDHLRFLAHGEAESRPWTSPPRGEYEIRRTTEKIKIDGELSEASWKTCAQTAAFRLCGGELPALSRTTARMMWNDRFLFVAIECEDLDIFATLKDRDDDLWKEDVVELFVAVPNAPQHYVEMAANPLNTLADIFDLQPGNGMVNWDAKGWQSAVGVAGNTKSRTDTDKGWTLEMAIPFLNFYVQPFLVKRAEERESSYAARVIKRPEDPPYAYNFRPLPGETWALNLFRIDHEKGHGEYQAWSPTIVQNFHTPSRFGKVTFSKQPVGR